jgi:hypothetical protein
MAKLRCILKGHDWVQWGGKWRCRRCGETDTDQP